MDRTHGSMPIQRNYTTHGVVAEEGLQRQPEQSGQESLQHGAAMVEVNQADWRRQRGMCWQRFPDKEKYIRSQQQWSWGKYLLCNGFPFVDSVPFLDRSRFRLWLETEKSQVALRMKKGEVTAENCFLETVNVSLTNLDPKFWDWILTSWAYATMTKSWVRDEDPGCKPHTNLAKGSSQDCL